MRKKKVKNAGQRMLKFYGTIVASVFLLGYCSDTFASKSRRAEVDSARFREVEDFFEQEAELVEKMEKMTERPVVKRKMNAGSPNMEDFLSLKVGAYEHAALYIPERDEAAQKKKLSGHVRNSLRCCRELVSWECGYEDGLGSVEGGPPGPESILSWETAMSVIADPSLTVPYLFQFGQVSMFDSPMEIANSPNQRVRFRVPVVHTDLARLLYLHQHARKGNQLTHCSLNGSQAITGEMFTAYQLASKVVAEVKQSHKSDYEIALALHDFLCRTVKYDMNMHAEANESLVVGALLRQQATSHGYARAYMLLLTMAGIDNRYVEGVFKLPGMKQTVMRSWNLVRLGESWVHVDVAADDPAPDDKNFISHSYFGLPQSLLGRTHGISRTPVDRKSIDTKGHLYYFAKNKLQFRSEEKLLHAVIDNAWPKRIRSAEYHCLNPRMTVDSINEALKLPSIQEKLENLNINKIHLSCQPMDAHGVIRISVKLNDEVVE